MTTYNYAPEVYDQGKEGACTANAICYEVQHILNQANVAYVPLGRQSLYNESRIIYGNFNIDNGVSPEYAFKAAHDLGIAPESDLSYAPANLYTRPDAQTTTDASHLKITGTTAINIYQNGPNLAKSFELALQHGQAAIISLNLRSGVFNETADNMTYDDKSPIAGGHMWICDKVIYDSNGNASALDFVSSWGTTIGDRGHFQMAPSQLSLGQDDRGIPILWDASTINGVVLNGQTIDVQWTDSRTAMSFDYLVLGRSADKAGLFYWASNLDAGMSQAQVLNFLIGSSEGQAIYGAENNTQYVDSLYQNLLGRVGDSAGVDWWASHLSTESRAQLASEFITAVEGTTGSDHDAMFNRSLVAGNGAITYQDNGLNHGAEVTALIGVNSNSNTVDGALHILHTALYGV